MPRRHRCEYGLSTGMFSVHQMHPETALRLALGASLGGLAKHGRSLQTMIDKYRTGLVVIGARVDYMRELTFFSEPFVATDTTAGLRDDGKLVVFRVRYSMGGEEAIAVQISLRPVKLTGGAALDAIPGPVDSEVRALFDSDEIVPRSSLPTRHLAADVQRATAGMKKIGEGGRPLFIGRSDCEFAEQWFFARLPSFAASVRERMLFDGAGALSVTAARPITTFQVEFFRPMYFGDRGRIEAEAYRQDDRVLVVHRFLGTPVPGTDGAGNGDRPLCALAVETF